MSSGFGDVVKRYLEIYGEIKMHSAKTRELRAELKGLKDMIISHMQNTDLEVIKVTQGEAQGELAIKQRNTRKQLKKADALEEIERYMNKNVGLDAGAAQAQAEKLWEALEDTREKLSVTDLSVRTARKQ